MYEPWIIGLLITVAVITIIIVQRYDSTAKASDNSIIVDMPEQLSGLCYTPYRRGQRPDAGMRPTHAQMTEDLQLISRRTDRIRTYTVSGPENSIPELACAQSLKVTLGVWIGECDQQNLVEIADAILLVRRFNNIESVIVSNEACLREEVSINLMIHYVALLRHAIDLPVSIAKPWHIWQLYPELQANVDFMAVRILPFRENISADQAVAFTIDRAQALQNQYPNKPLVITEAGWPSSGRAHTGALGKPADQAIYLRRLTHALDRQEIRYFIKEAFDQPWKNDEGSVGSHWGIFDSNRRAKFASHGPLRIRGRRHFFMYKCSDLPVLNFTGWIIFWINAIGSCMLTTWITCLLNDSPLPLPPFTFALCCFILLLILLATECHELFESSIAHRQQRLFTPVVRRAVDPPKVSIHLPCYSEPADIVMASLDALAALDYPNYEVLVIDNNTPDDAQWKPIEAHCKRLGDQFRFYHVNPLTGFKSGALNYALDRTALDASIIAVIDADYIVHPNWLRYATPIFATPNISVVQAPQDYRDANTCAFKQCCYWEYQRFFNIGMVIRNNHDAIIQHGTMTLIKKSVLQQLRWAEWSICEDAELGLRILEHGYATAFVTRSYGKGMIPDTFYHFKQQRYRWVYGAVQIIKKHHSSLFFRNLTHLTFAQRYHFIAGWAPWVAHGVGIIKTIALAAWSTWIIVFQRSTDIPPAFVTVPMLVLATFHGINLVYLHYKLAGIEFRAACASALAGLALYPVIGKAVIHSIVSKNLAFSRTSKAPPSHYELLIFPQVREELAIASWLCLLAITGVLQGNLSVSRICWCLWLIMESIPYWAALTMAVQSVHGHKNDPGR